MEYLNANIEKITRVIGDFNELHFKNEEFNYIVCDASLHHIPMDNLIKVLQNIHKILKRNGKVIAINEPFLSSIPIFDKFRKYIFGLHEKRYGVTENIFTKKEWENMLTNVGFKCNFILYDIQVNNTLEFKNLIKKFIKYSPLKHIFHVFFPRYFIILKKK